MPGGALQDAPPLYLIMDYDAALGLCGYGSTIDPSHPDLVGGLLDYYGLEAKSRKTVSPLLRLFGLRIVDRYREILQPPICPPDLSLRLLVHPVPMCRVRIWPHVGAIRPDFQ